MNEWISVKDRSPPKDKPFLGYVLLGFHCEGLEDNREKDIQVCYWHKIYEDFKEGCNCSGYEFDREYVEIIKWMPLPKPPEE